MTACTFRKDFNGHLLILLMFWLISMTVGSRDKIQIWFPVLLLSAKKAKNAHIFSGTFEKILIMILEIKVDWCYNEWCGFQMVCISVAHIYSIL